MILLKERNLPAHLQVVYCDFQPGEPCWVWAVCSADAAALQGHQESLGDAQAVSHLQLCWSFDCDSVPSGKP